MGQKGKLATFFQMDLVKKREIGKMKDLFTTGEAAKVCKVSQQTIIRCFDAGRVEGFRIPGSKFRRIPRANLIKFMRDNHIPLDNMESGRKKILVVDDDAEIVELIVDILQRDDKFHVATASSGYEAGVQTQKFRPDLILLDYMLPDVNGNVVCQTIKSNPDFASTKIIIISGVVKQDEIDHLMQSGADSFVKKPFTVSDLTKQVEDALVMN